jgi:ribosomal protein L19
MSYYCAENKQVKFRNFSIPSFSTLEDLCRYRGFNNYFTERTSPQPGDLVFVRYFERMSGRHSVFRLYSCYGLCISRRQSGLTSHFTIRNSFKRNSLELRFFLYSPLLARIVSYDSKRRRYNKAKLYYLRLKKIAKSRFRFEKFKKLL